MRVLLFSSVLFVAAAGVIAAGDDRVNIAVSPLFSTAPSHVHVRVRVAPNAENRMLQIIADSEDFYRRSDVQMDGEESPATVELDLPGLPGGEYEVRAVLIDSTGKECAASSAKATVISHPREP